MEFESASSTASALLFDRTKLAGQTVSVAVVEEELPDEVWDGEAEGEELFERVEHDETSPFAAAEPAAPAAAAAVARAPTQLPPPAVLPPPNAYEKSSRTSAQPSKAAATPARDKAATPKRDKAASAAPAGSVAAERAAREHDQHSEHGPRYVADSAELTATVAAHNTSRRSLALIMRQSG